ncbi:MAG: ABC transporter permease [Parcubacteria group bacterium]|nr:ABC transporter permease [Parcubacteria group bacterium]
MFWINIKRIIRSGFVNFWRNGFVSLASILVITITLFLIGSLIFFSAVLNFALDELRNKVDINVYFTTAAPEGDILALKGNLESLTEVSSVAYISRDEALAEFRTRHENDFLTLQALEELGENPLGASFNIRATETSQYESIARFLENVGPSAEGNSSIIDSINYNQNKVAIERLGRVIDGAETLGIAIIVVMAAISIVIVFNTVRLAIYTSREEISVMRLVGAENRFIRGPFMIEGFLYGIFSAVVSLIIFYPVTAWMGGATERFFGGINVFDYYIANFGQIFLIITVSGIVLGVISSYIAVRRYLGGKYYQVK